MKNKIFDLINDSKSIVLLTHESPDGDAIGSLMGFYYMLTLINKNVDVILPQIPKIFSCFDSNDKVIENSSKKYDLAIVVDCANRERIGQIDDILINCKHTIGIDHHASNTRYCDINYIEEDTAACCQVIYYLFKNWNININQKIGEALTIGLLTDSMGFMTNNVDKNSFLMGADMLELGVNICDLYYRVLVKKTMPQYLLMKMVLDRIELFGNGKIAFSYISSEDLENVGALPGDYEGLVELGRNIDGIEVSIFMREEDGYRISFRSTGKVNVNEIASKFNGGGHKMAAGARIMSSFKETKELLINETLKVLGK